MITSDAFIFSLSFCKLSYASAVVEDQKHPYFDIPIKRYIRIQLKKNMGWQYKGLIIFLLRNNLLFSKMVSSITKSRFCLLTNQNAYILGTSVNNSLQSSGSFLLSLGYFLSSVAKIYPQSVLIPTTQNKAEKDSKKDSLKQPEQYFQIWCDYLFSLLSGDSLMQIENQCVVFGKVSDNYLKYCLESGLFEEVSGFSEKVDIKQLVAQQVFNTTWSTTPEQKKKKILIINLSMSVTNTDKTKAKINVDGLFSGIFYQNGDLWKSYKILLKEIPTIEELLQADTVMISGSTFSVNKKHEYMKIFVENLMEALEINKKLKVLGFCFGHQLVAQAHGARIEKRQLTRGPEIISSQTSHNLGEVGYLSELQNGESFKIKIYQFHSDYVVNAPEGFTCIGSSSTCQNEIFISEDKRIFTFQFHPEYLLEYIRSIEKRWGSENSLFKGIHQDNYNYDQEHHRTCEIFRRTIRKFIDWKVESS